MFVHRKQLSTLSALALLVCFALQAEEVPAGTVLQIHLRQRVSSFSSKRLESITAAVISPYTQDGRILIPLDSEVVGYIAVRRQIGFGISHETAMLHLVFDSLRLPNGEVMPVKMQVSDLDNAREKLGPDGRIEGIRATASFSSVLSGMAVSATALDPMLLAFGLASSTSVFRIPESEIILPVGTELHVKLLEPISLTHVFPPAAPSLVTSAEDRAALTAMAKRLDFRTFTETGNLPSDVTNLIFIGSQDGWAVTDALDRKSTYGTLRSILENQGYREAPMSTLLLGGKKPVYTYSKTLNTFFKRHHLRVFPQPVSYLGAPVWTASSTHDSGVGIAAKTKSFIHIIDQNIDQERDKIMNDLVLTGCVESIDYVDRPWVPRDAKNSTGDSLLTDGRAGVVRFNGCVSPRRADTPKGPPVSREKANSFVRVTRDVVLTLKNDAYRGNLLYQGYSAARLALDSRNKIASTERSFAYGGQDFKLVPGGEAVHHPDTPKGVHKQLHNREPGAFETRLEFSLNGGYVRFAGDRFSTQRLTLNLAMDPPILVPITFTNEFRPGFVLAPRVTLVGKGRVSHEFGFNHNKTVHALRAVSADLSDDTLKASGYIRQFSYNTLLHLRKNQARVRPYFAAGGGLQVIRLSEETKHPNGLIKFAYRDLGIVLNAYRGATEPPFEGGTIYQPMLQYGGGVKFQARPRLILRADFRETLSSQPDLWKHTYGSLKSDLTGLEIQFDKLRKYGPMRQQTFTIGAGVAF